MNRITNEQREAIVREAVAMRDALLTNGVAPSHARIDEPEDFCGLQQTVSDRETAQGTKYEIARWTCPNCGKACSCIYVDGEWCHGDSLSISFGPEKDADGTWTRHHKCGACWLPGSASNAGVQNTGGTSHE